MLVHAYAYALSFCTEYFLFCQIIIPFNDTTDWGGAPKKIDFFLQIWHMNRYVYALLSSREVQIG
jgi:hypothetical protein